MGNCNWCSSFSIIGLANSLQKIVCSNVLRRRPIVIGWKVDYLKSYGTTLYCGLLICFWGEKKRRNVRIMNSIFLLSEEIRCSWLLMWSHLFVIGILKLNLDWIQYIRYWGYIFENLTSPKNRIMTNWQVLYNADVMYTWGMTVPQNN